MRRSRSIWASHQRIQMPLLCRGVSSSTMHPVKTLGTRESWTGSSQNFYSWFVVGCYRHMKINILYIDGCQSPFKITCKTSAVQRTGKWSCSSVCGRRETTRQQIKKQGHNLGKLRGQCVCFKGLRVTPQLISEEMVPCPLYACIA